MLIFDSFRTVGEATAFADKVKEFLGLDADAYTERRDDIDPFPFELVAPVVYVDRPEYTGTERLVCGMVGRYNGRFAGT